VNSTLNAAIEAMKQGNNALAVSEFLAVLKIESRNQVAWYDLGVIAQKNGQATLAANDYLRSLTADPKYVPALYNLAILETPKEPHIAATLYQRAIKDQPSDAAAHLNLGFVYLSLGQRIGGEEEIAVAVKLDPSLNSRVPASARG
jgi:tetratricopeptide (TPR) repeat protein